MRFERSSGVLLHVSSLPGPHGIGDFGTQAHRFVDFLHRAGQAVWQILPLGPNDQGNPYMAESSWAGSPFFVSLDALVEAGDLTAEEVAPLRIPDARFVEHARILGDRQRLLARAADRFHAAGRPEEQERFARFCAEEKSWLEDWALFTAARRRFLRPWWEWPAPIALRDPGALQELREAEAQSLARERYVQFRFYEQLAALRASATERGIQLVGDVPIYCARGSADVWAARHLFQLDAHGNPTVVSGVPPDYFAADGQLWGTPLYDWERNHAEGYAWWIARLRSALRLCDVVRIDHFRAFDTYWEVPASAPTARDGRWMPGPGDDFFAAVRASLGDAPFIAEDLGIITRGVRELRDRWELPGMRVLQFAFAEPAVSPHFPAHHVPHCVVYTGTHDNDTAVGWYQSAPAHERDNFRRYTASDGGFCHWHLMRVAFASVADLAIVPMQDVLGLDSSARMNTPGVAAGNWRWKLLPEEIGDAPAELLRSLAHTFARLPEQSAERRAALERERASELSSET